MKNYVIAENLQLKVYSGEEATNLKIVRTSKHVAYKYLFLNNLHIGHLKKVNTGSNDIYMLFINCRQIYVGTEEHCIEIVLQHLKQ